VTIQAPTQVTSCCNLLAPIRQLSSKSRNARMSFSQEQRVFIVEHHLASRSYLTCQNEFRDAFPDSPVPNKSTISRLVNRFHDTGTLNRVASNMRIRVNRWTRWTFSTLNMSLFVSDFDVIYFLTNRTCVRNGLRDFSTILYMAGLLLGQQETCSYRYVKVHSSSLLNMLVYTVYLRIQVKHRALYGLLNKANLHHYSR
jgi:hypothetical protein